MTISIFFLCTLKKMVLRFSFFHVCKRLVKGLVTFCLVGISTVPNQQIFIKNVVSTIICNFSLLNLPTKNVFFLGLILIGEFMFHKRLRKRNKRRHVVITKKWKKIVKIKISRIRSMYLRFYRNAMNDAFVSTLEYLE